MRHLVVAILLGIGTGFLEAEPVQAQDAPQFLAPGQTAPDFSVTGATRYGVLSESVSLSDFRGETVVLAFFFRARTRG